MSKKLITLLLFGIFANGAFAVDTIPISQNVQMQQQNSAVEDEDDDMISLGDDEVSSNTTKIEIKDDLSLSDLLNLDISSGSFLDLDLSKSPISLTLIDKRKIKLSGARNMSELLEVYVPGFQYMYNKWNGTLWGMRGVANDRNTKIIYLINGHKMNSQSRDGFASEQTLGLLGDIERVEVLRGPAGLVYGSGAIAGIINVITKAPKDNESSVSVAYGSNNTKEVEANVNKKIDADASVGFSIGYKESDGLTTHQSRLYGKHSWPYPNWFANADLDINGVPSDGNYGATPGNYKAALDVNYKKLKVYTRYTHQVEEAGGWFPVDLWPEIIGAPDSTSSSRSIRNPFDPISASYDDVFYPAIESWGTNRREYINDNAFLNVDYSLPIDKNELRFNAGIDAYSSVISTEMRDGYENEYIENRLPSVDEEWGEMRYNFGVTFMLKSIEKLQLAAGTDFRVDNFGESFNNLNSKGGNLVHPIIYDTSYTNLALFTEGFYDFSEKIGFHGGLRFDNHTHAAMFNGKFATIYTPLNGHTIKAIVQSSSNNGSVDNYEYNRWHYNGDGSLRLETTFERPGELPTIDTPLLQSSPDVETLHSLKPERVINYELTSTHNFIDMVTLMPSLTYGQVRDIFGWNQTLFRVVNAGSYDYLNFDIEVNIKTEMFDIGINHTYQRPYNTEVSEQSAGFIIDTLDYSQTDWYIADSSNGTVTYTPNPSGKGLQDVNIVRDAITYDGYHFNNLATNLSKIYIDFSPTSWVTLHTDARIFWGLAGREFVYAQQEAEGFQYWGIWQQNWANAIKKVNASACFNLKDGWELGLYAYDIFGVDNGIAGRDQNDIFNGNPINALRWQQMAEPGQLGIATTDQRSYAVKVNKTF